MKKSGLFKEKRISLTERHSIDVGRNGDSAPLEALMSSAPKTSEPEQADEVSVPLPNMD